MLPNFLPLKHPIKSVVALLLQTRTIAEECGAQMVSALVLCFGMKTG